MNMIQAGKIAEITGAKILSFHSDILLHQLLTDSRKIISPSQSLFFAIKGVRHDGHTFTSDLYQKGVRCFIIENESTINLKEYPEASFWLVPDTILALQQIVSAYRKLFTFPVIAITGSNGKTIVKEWLSQLLQKNFQIVKNPKSYNSQIGVPLSVWEMNNRHNLGIFEAGISLPNEMARLKSIVEPTIGILTNIGPAHDEGFNSPEEKIKEKLKLFANVDLLFYRKEYSSAEKYISDLPCKKFNWSTTKKADIQIIELHKHTDSTDINFVYVTKNYSLNIPFIDDASIENCIHCICVMLYFKIPVSEIQNRLYTLQPLAMRLELKEGINGSYLIDDTYNNDLSGLTMALNFLDQKKQRNSKTIILSDILESGIEEQKLYHQIAEMLKEKRITNIVGIGDVIGRNRSFFKDINSNFYNTTEEFISNFNSKEFSNQLILVKGARVFGFERIVQLLQQKVHGTVLEINLDALTHNLNFYRSQLKTDTKIMVMVKALAYGSGSFEVANLLQYHRVDYLAVAYADEGVALRENGITLPIMVMNPSAKSFEVLLRHKLEPELYNFKITEEFIQYLDATQQNASVHLKLDTGMRRLGFEEKDLQKLFEKISSTTRVKIAGIFTHLAAADEEMHNEFSRLQLQKFAEMADILEKKIGYATIRHALNSAGIIRFPKAQFNMVRLGIGLYGVEANGLRQHELQTVGTLKTIISQIKKVDKGESIGYSRKGKANQNTTVATIAVGYADGYDRRFSNGVGYVMINGKKCPIIGNVCMDMCMVDITDVNASEGDEVIVFGQNPSIINLSEAIETIPYELLTGISERVKRVFFAE